MLFELLIRLNMLPKGIPEGLYEEDFNLKKKPKVPFMCKLLTSAFILGSLALPAYAQEVRGTVKDSDGKPVKGALLYSVPLSDLASVGEIDETDSNGFFEFPSPKNSSIIVPSYRGINFPPETVLGGQDRTIEFALPIQLPENRRVLGRSVTKGNYFVLEAYDDGNGNVSIELYARPESLRDRIHPKGSGIITLSSESNPSDVKMFIGGNDYVPPAQQEELVQMLFDFIGEQAFTLPFSFVQGVAAGLSLKGAKMIGKSGPLNVDLGEPLDPAEGNIHIYSWRSLPSQFKDKQPVRIDLIPGEGEVYAHFMFDYSPRNMAPHRLAGLDVRFALPRIPDIDTDAKTSPDSIAVINQYLDAFPDVKAAGELDIWSYVLNMDENTLRAEYGDRNLLNQLGNKLKGGVDKKEFVFLGNDGISDNYELVFHSEEEKASIFVRTRKINDDYKITSFRFQGEPDYLKQEWPHRTRFLYSRDFWKSPREGKVSWLRKRQEDLEMVFSLRDDGAELAKRHYMGFLSEMIYLARTGEDREFIMGARRSYKRILPLGPQSEPVGAVETVRSNN